MRKNTTHGGKKKSCINVCCLPSQTDFLFRQNFTVKAKYGDDAEDIDSDLSSSSDDDEVGAEFTEEIEKKFFKTLSCLKNKDPRIYDQNVKFFDDTDTIEAKNKNKEKKEKPVFIKDYERQLLLEKGGQISDSDGEEQQEPPRYFYFIENIFVESACDSNRFLALPHTLKNSRS